MKAKRINNWRKIFNFDISREKAIYKYLCREKIGSLERKLILNYKFDSYFQWKNYVVEKYKAYSVNSLTEFSRYFNYNIRKQGEMKGALGLFLSPVAACIVAQMLDKEFYNTDQFWNVVIYILLLIMLAWVIRKNIELSVEDKMNSAFFEDYKEIIDELIAEKLSTNPCKIGIFEDEISTKEIELSSSQRP